MIRRPPRSTQSRSSAASDVYKRERECPSRGKSESVVHVIPLAFRGTRVIHRASTGQVRGFQNEKRPLPVSKGAIDSIGVSKGASADKDEEAANGGGLWIIRICAYNSLVATIRGRHDGWSALDIANRFCCRNHRAFAHAWAEHAKGFYPHHRARLRRGGARNVYR